MVKGVCIMSFRDEYHESMIEKVGQLTRIEEVSYRLDYWGPHRFPIFRIENDMESV